MYITKLTMEDAQELLAFEKNNRAYFEQSVPGRGDDYFKVPNFQKQLENLLEEQEEGRSYFYLIKNEEREIVGRMNLVDLDDARTSGSIGYRVGKAHLGKGIATKGLLLLIEEAKRLNLKTLYAKTTSNNLASQKVMEKNGFVKSEVEKEAVRLHGQSLDFVHYRLEL